MLNPEKNNRKAFDRPEVRGSTSKPVEKMPIDLVRDAYTHQQVNPELAGPQRGEALLTQQYEQMSHLPEKASPEVQQLREERAGLGERSPWAGYEKDGYWQARFLTLRDPNNKLHHFYCGELDEYIANETSFWIEDQLARGKELDQTEELTKDDVAKLKPGDEIKGWKCTEKWYEPVPISTFYTDKGRPIPVVERVPYHPLPDDKDRIFDGIVVSSANPNYSCFGKAFLEGTGTPLVGDSDIQAILDDNGYQPVSNHEKARKADIAIFRSDGSFKHGAPVIGWVEKGKTPLDPDKHKLFAPPEGGWGGDYRVENYNLWLGSKLGHDVDTLHVSDSPHITFGYGKPMYYRTERVGGNMLRKTWPPEEPALDRAILSHPLDGLGSSNA